jgi:hypothetical protein
MKRQKHLVPGMVMLAILFFLSMAAVSAQELDNKWFVVNCQVTSRAVNPITGNITQYNFGFKAYVYFSYNGPAKPPVPNNGPAGELPSPIPFNGSSYYCEVWSQTSPGLWKITSSGDRNTSQISENFFPDWNMHFHTKNGTSVTTYATPHVSVTLNLFKAGGEIYTGNDPQGRYLFGWMTISGQLATSLPFHPL